ncbi:hypothetical protein SELMODRAFT_72257, partial [Selaginella moellendorffii]
NALVAAFAHNGHLDAAKAMFDKLPDRNLMSWNAMIAAYSQYGRCRDALLFFRCMNCDGGGQPNAITFSSVLTACSHAGLLRESWRHFTSMVGDFGIQPVREHYCCIVDVLGRSGELSDAEDLIHNMPFLPTDITWRTFLSACRTHRQASDVKVAAENIVEIDPSNDAAYLTLANSYA